MQFNQKKKNVEQNKFIFIENLQLFTHVPSRKKCVCYFWWISDSEN